MRAAPLPMLIEVGLRSRQQSAAPMAPPKVSLLRLTGSSTVPLGFQPPLIEAKWMGRVRRCQTYIVRILSVHYNIASTRVLLQIWDLSRSLRQKSAGTEAADTIG